MSGRVSKSKKQQIKLSDDDLITLSVKDLNGLLSGLPANEVRKLKHRRRTLKNRGYAAHCREKRVVQKEELATEKETLAQENDRLQRENNDMKDKLKNLKRTYEQLSKFKNSQVKNVRKVKKKIKTEPTD
ncbi:uncharacterized protein LOC141909329 [Tubulanus polymorphus]|uniref:uncharacterized protein LOC141909329 n=1 Tax=Tubulanus polymorphus TaxID=672921 RepID=UPI003DA4481A